MGWCWSGIGRAEQGGYMAVVGQKDIGAPGWQLAQAEAVPEMQQPCDLELLLRPCGLCRDPRRQPVAIVGYDESVCEVP